MEPLEYLADANGCFISDLRCRDIQTLDFAPLLELPADAFSLKGWNRLLEYLFPELNPCRSVQEVRQRLLARLQRQ